MAAARSPAIESGRSGIAGSTATMKAKAKFVLPTDGPRQLEAAKMSRLRALRLAKEAVDQEAAAVARAAAEAARKSVKRRRVRAPAPAASDPT